MAVLIPTTAPVESTSGPPELPGLIAASVWIASITALASVPAASRRTGRFTALTMPVGDGAGQPQRRSDRDHAVADDEAGRRSDGGHHRVRDLHLHDGEVGLRVAPDDLGRGASAVVEDRLDLGAGDLGGRGHHVVVREDVAGRVDDHPGAGAALVARPRISNETTAGTVRAAMSATEPGGRSLRLDGLADRRVRAR